MTTLEIRFESNDYGSFDYQILKSTEMNDKERKLFFEQFGIDLPKSFTKYVKSFTENDKNVNKKQITKTKKIRGFNQW